MLASEHVMSVYVVWKFSKSQEVAKEFLVALIDASRESMLASKLYNFPSFYGAVADPGTPMSKKYDSGAAWIDKQCNNDPFGSKPADKLARPAKAPLADQPRLPGLRQSGRGRDLRYLPDHGHVRQGGHRHPLAQGRHGRGEQPFQGDLQQVAQEGHGFRRLEGQVAANLRERIDPDRSIRSPGRVRLSVRV